MLLMYLPSAGVQIEFKNGWRVTPAAQGADSVSFTPGEYPNDQLAKFITFFPSMWSSVKAQEKQGNEMLIALKPAHLAFSLPAGFHWDLSGQHVPAARPFGLEFSYDDGISSWSLEDMLSLFQMLASAAPEDRESWVMGALHKNFKKRRFYYLQAMKTGHCVRFDLDKKVWEEFRGEVEGEATVSSVGVTSYINDGDTEPNASDIITGMDLLTRAVSVDYSTDLIADVPEDVFERVPFNTSIEQAIPMVTDVNKLFYFLNADYTANAPTEKREVPVEKAPLPVVSWHSSPDAGTPLVTGGSFTLEGGAGTYEMYDVVRWLDAQLEAYQAYAAEFDESKLPVMAVNEFVAKFCQVRVDVAPSRMDTHLPIQLVLEPTVYAWDSVRWFTLLGSQPVNPEAYKDFRFIHKTVDVSPAEWTTLLQTCIDTFMGPTKGLAALYYRTAELPEEADAFDGELCITDPRTMLGVRFNGAKLVEEGPVEQYSSEHVSTNVGLVIEYTGQGSVSSSTLADIIAQAYEASMWLLNERFSRINDLCAETAFGTYELLHQCMPAAMFSVRPQVNSGAMGDIDAPIVLYKDKQRISHTTKGWYYNNVAHDRTKKAGAAGEYKVAYERGTMPWDEAVATLFKDVLELTLDYDDPAVVASLELEHAQ